MKDESLILANPLSLASADGVNLSAFPGVLAWIHATDAVHTGGNLHASLSVQLDPQTAFVPVGGACQIRFQVCAVASYRTPTELITDVATLANIPLATYETSTTGFFGTVTVPLPRLTTTANYIQVLVWVFPNGSDGITSGLVGVSLAPLDDNAASPFPNGI